MSVPSSVNDLIEVPWFFSGKTHTMMGHDSDRGIISLTMERLFAHLEKMETDHVIEMQASYFEIYNENILDLLRPGKRVGRSMREGSVHVNGSGSVGLVNVGYCPRFHVHFFQGKSEAKSLEIREVGKNVLISGLSHHSVTTMEQIFELIEVSPVNSR